jgi:thymidylate synthase (FAD)
MKKGYTINVLDHGFVRYIDKMGTDRRICEAARISYKSPSKGKKQDQKLIEYLWKHRHTSPFEMAKITFNIGLPIFVMRQFVRHRMQNLNEVSGRYTKLPDVFYIPNEWRKQDTKNRQGSVKEENWKPYLSYGRDTIDATSELKRHCESSYYLYQKMIEAGIAREMARMVLPINIYTEIYSTWDMNNLLKFFALRDEEHAQEEIQVYAKVMKEICRNVFPLVMKAYDKYKFTIIEAHDNTQSTQEN